MKLSVRIVAARRKLRRMEEDKPLFLQRISTMTESEQEFCIRFFNKYLEEMKQHLNELLKEDEMSKY